MLKKINLIIFAIFVFFLPIVPTSINAGEFKAEIIDTQKIWDYGAHNAFTDLIRFNNQWFCVFREGSSHIPGSNGVIRVIKSSDGNKWESAALISEKGVDLRDPKICITPENNLMLLMGGSIYDGVERAERRKLVSARTRVSFSKNGIEWTVPQPISVPDNNWLWRVTFHKGKGYGFSYNIGVPYEQFKITLWMTSDGIKYRKIITPEVPKDCYPDEVTIRFQANDTAIALIRNERDSGPAFIGISQPPYTNWTFKNSGAVAQGPNFIILPDEIMVYSGRAFPQGPKTVFGIMTGEKLFPLINLPSGRDTSYPGLVWHDGLIWVSYYSTHDGKSSIYLAKIKLTHSP